MRRRRSGMTWTFLTYIRDALRDGQEEALLKENIPRELLEKVTKLTLDEIEDLDWRYPALFPAVVNSELLTAFLNAIHQGASENELREIAEKWYAENPYGPNVIKFPQK